MGGPSSTREKGDDGTGHRCGSFRKQQPGSSPSVTVLDTGGTHGELFKDRCPISAALRTRADE